MAVILAIVPLSFINLAIWVFHPAISIINASILIFSDLARINLSILPFKAAYAMRAALSAHLPIIVTEPSVVIKFGGDFKTNIKV